MNALILLMASVCAQPAVGWVVSTDPPSSRAPDLRAEQWVNGLTVRPMDERPWIILLFHLHPSKDDAKTFEADLRKHVESLNRIAKARSDVVVVALTPEKEDAVRRFAAQLHVRFPIGVGSTSHRELGVTRFPSVVRIQKGEAVRELTLSDLPRLDLPEPLDDAAPVSAWSSERIMEGLRAQQGESVDGALVDQGLETLAARMDALEFMAFCDEIEGLAEGAPAWVGRVRYQRHLADPGVEQKQSHTGPVAQALAAWRESPGDPKWAPFNEAAQQLEATTDWTSDQAFKVFQAHPTEAPNDLLIRHALAGCLRDCGDEMLPALRNMAAGEADPIIKTRFLLCLVAAAPPQDAETLAFLEAQLTTEKNIRWVRPTLEFAIQRIRTK